MYRLFLVVPAGQRQVINDLSGYTLRFDNNGFNHRIGGGRAAGGDLNVIITDRIGSNGKLRAADIVRTDLDGLRSRIKQVEPGAFINADLYTLRGVQIVINRDFDGEFLAPDGRIRQVDSRGRKAGKP